ncbi:MAG: FAD-dependent oxidoreductase, partial [Reyranella sp.]
MKIAVIGAGVSGLGAAWLLSRRHDVVVYERENRFGGHSCTVEAPTKQGRQPVDVGFIVFNERNYPNLVALFDHLGVPTEPSDMSFAVSLDEGGFEYASSFAGYFAQRGNLARPSFLRMTHDILRFNRMAPQLLDKAEDLDFTIGNFIDQSGFGDAFRDRYLVPMAACIWSTPPGRMLDYPAQTFARFFNNHGLLTIGPQLQWRTVSGGSRSYEIGRA